MKSGEMVFKKAKTLQDFESLKIGDFIKARTHPYRLTETKDGSFYFQFGGGCTKHGNCKYLLISFR